MAPGTYQSDYHSITSDPEDQIFALAEKEDKIRAYYIGEKRLITLMMKMDADVVSSFSASAKI